MLNGVVIKVENLSKRYRIGTREAGYRTFRETLTDAAKAPFRHLKNGFHKSTVRSQPSSANDHIWALKDVSFEVKRGEVVGIIGRNGAGKSTLLKILSKITEPTNGRIELRGRVGSLLEVGTGFHPELTGHENVYLYGAILGMDRWEVTRKFDEIVAFAELERFIETPVKKYSSGMYMRLAFAVAAFLEPEILLIDEVLAVGDTNFQRKCIGKMNDVSKKGRTVLFVSHNMGAVQSLCTKAMLIERGDIKIEGAVRNIVGNYLIGDSLECETTWRYDRQGTRLVNEVMHPFKVSLLDKDNKILPSVVQRNQEVYIEIVFSLFRLDPQLTIGISLFNTFGEHLFRSLHTDMHNTTKQLLKIGKNILKVRIPIEILNEGEYRVVLDGGLHKIEWLYNPDECDISVQFSVSGGLSKSPFWIHARKGIIAPILDWEIL